MFSADEIRAVATSSAFGADLNIVHEALSRNRLGQQHQLFVSSALPRLGQFVECVLSSAPDWDAPSRATLCQTAGQVAEALAFQEGANERMRFRSAGCGFVQHCFTNSLAFPQFPSPSRPRTICRLLLSPFCCVKKGSDC